MAAIVLLPGMDGTGELFSGFAAALGDELRTQVISYPPDHALDYRSLADFVRERLPLEEPYVLLGESFSGPVAIALAAEGHPGLLGLVLCCTFARNPFPAASRRHPLTALMPVNSRLFSLAGPLLRGGHALPELSRVLEHVPASVLRARLREVMKVDYSARIDDIKVPVLYLQAKDDHIVPVSAARHLETHCPSMLIKRFTAPHLLLQTVPVEAAAQVLEFTSKLLHQSR
ncbi:MAG: alpha/beta fold hydrolase [Telluria sp.]|nr:alpha/beta fold hydrolase [Telluria sp.]